MTRNFLFLALRAGCAIQNLLLQFCGALYLSPLDRAFTDRKGIFYLRYMDDILILTETKK